MSCKQLTSAKHSVLNHGCFSLIKGVLNCYCALTGCEFQGKRTQSSDINHKLVSLIEFKSRYSFPEEFSLENYSI